MSFVLYTLLTDDSLEITNDFLIDEVNTLLGGWSRFTIQLEQLPFANSTNLFVQWADWYVRLCYEEGEQVFEDSKEIQRRVGMATTPNVSEVKRRIRVVFGDDPNLDYTDHMVTIMDFLCKLQGAIVYDPQQNNFVD
jgi:hypothetical protein